MRFFWAMLAAIYVYKWIGEEAGWATFFTLMALAPRGKEK